MLQKYAASVVVLAAGAMCAAGAVVVGAEVDGLAAERAAAVDEFLEFLDGHGDGVFGRWEKGQRYVEVWLVSF